MLYDREYNKFKAQLIKKLGFEPYDLEPIMALEALYRVIFGERSNGKTYSVLEYCLYNAWHQGHQFAYIRRMEEDIRGKRGQELCAALGKNGSIEAMTGGEWDSVKYYAGRFFWQRTVVIDDKYATETSDEPIGYAFALSQSEHDKGASYLGVKYIMLDEFISRSAYLTDEFVLFMNTCSTIIRNRNDVQIFLLGNTVNAYCPYFQDMGLTHAKELAAGKIDVYNYGDSGLRVAVEHTLPTKHGKQSDVYFAFDNPKLRMITQGEWEIATYPHRPHRPERDNIMWTCYIVFDGDAVRLDIVDEDAGCWVNVEPCKWTPTKREKVEKDDTIIVYTPEPRLSNNYRDKITNPRYPCEHLLIDLLEDNKWLYATNTAGEIVRNYMMYCGVRLD